MDVSAYTHGGFTQRQARTLVAQSGGSSSNSASYLPKPSKLRSATDTPFLSGFGITSWNSADYAGPDPELEALYPYFRNAGWFQFRTSSGPFLSNQGQFAPITLDTFLSGTSVTANTSSLRLDTMIGIFKAGVGDTLVYSEVSDDYGDDPLQVLYQDRHLSRLTFVPEPNSDYFIAVGEYDDTAQGLPLGLINPLVLRWSGINTAPVVPAYTVQGQVVGDHSTQLSIPFQLGMTHRQSIAKTLWVRLTEPAGNPGVEVLFQQDGYGVIGTVTVPTGDTQASLTVPSATAYVDGDRVITATISNSPASSPTSSTLFVCQFF